MKPLPKIVCRGIRADHHGKPFNPEMSYWVEGDVSYHRDGRVFIRNWDMGAYKAFEIVPNTLGVFTGFTDVNHRRIFTGDLLRITLEVGGKSISAESYVYFDNGCFCVNWGKHHVTFQGDDRFRSRLDGFNPLNTTLEVIGDISTVTRTPIILSENMEQKFQSWMSSVAHSPAESFHGDGLYAGVDGCKRLARECAPAILDFGEYGEKNIGATYSSICVIAYNLCPPVDAKVWVGWIYEKLDELRNTQ